MKKPRPYVIIRCVDEVSTSAEEMTALVEEVSASAQTLADLSKELLEIVSQFTLK